MLVPWMEYSDFDRSLESVLPRVFLVMAEDIGTYFTKSIFFYKIFCSFSCFGIL
jgi:hypothetical protein